jgi:hypothetical protein
VCREGTLTAGYLRNGIRYPYPFLSTVHVQFTRGKTIRSTFILMRNSAFQSRFAFVSQVIWQYKMDLFPAVLGSRNYFGRAKPPGTHTPKT